MQTKKPFIIKRKSTLSTDNNINKEVGEILEKDVGSRGESSVDPFQQSQNMQAVFARSLKEKKAASRSPPNNSELSNRQPSPDFSSPAPVQKAGAYYTIQGQMVQDKRGMSVRSNSPEVTLVNVDDVAQK